MRPRFTESPVEQAALAWLEGLGWAVRHSPDIAPDMPAAERRNYGEVGLAQRLRDALTRLNPDLPAEALEDAFRKLRRLESANPVTQNRAEPPAGGQRGPRVRHGGGGDPRRADAGDQV